MLKTSHAKHLQFLPIVFLMFFLSDTAQADNMGDLPVVLFLVAFLVFVYLPLGLMCLGFYVQFIRTKAYFNVPRLKLFLVIFGFLALLGAFPVSYFLRYSLWKFILFSGFWWLVSSLSLFLYYKHWRNWHYLDATLMNERKFKRIVWINFLFYLIFCVFVIGATLHGGRSKFYHPSVQTQQKRANERYKKQQEEKKRDAEAMHKLKREWQKEMKNKEK